MKFLLSAALALLLVGCAGLTPEPPSTRILVDLDPASVDRTVIVENITADRHGLLYRADTARGALWVVAHSPRFSGLTP